MAKGHFCTQLFYGMMLIWLFLPACSLFAPKTAQNKMTEPIKMMPSERTERRPMLNARANAYEGSIWRDEASFGNLFRDHRARYRHDLLTINEVAKIVTVPPPKEAPPDKAKTDQEKATAVLESISLRDTLEEEQNSILRALDTISAEVVAVQANGNMVIRGQKIDNRQNNQIRYVTVVTGILRPKDVTESNVVSATKLVYPEVKVSRQIQGNLLRTRLQALAPLLGKQDAGLLERISDFSKAPKSGTTSVQGK